MSILGTPLNLKASAQEVEIWSNALFLESISRTFLSKFLGEGPSSLFQMMTEVSDGPGDTINVDLLTQTSNLGVNGNTTLKGAEQQLAYQAMVLNVEQKRQAFDHFRMSQQRTIHDLRKDAMIVLRDFFASVLDRYAAAFLLGTVGDETALGTDITNHGANALAVPDAAHLIDSSATIFTPALIDQAKWKAATIPAANNGPVRPIMVDGQEWYVMFLHPRQAEQLQTNTVFTQAQREAQLRGSDNPIFSGALGTWNGVILHAWNYLPQETILLVLNNYAVLCGAQALSVGFGQAISTLDSISREVNRENGFPFWWAEEVEDYGNEVGISGATVFGMRKSEFATFDFATVRVQTKDA